jgi:hypothetical protein
MRLDTISSPAYSSDYESFTKVWFPADMNRVKGASAACGALLYRDHGTKQR